METSLRIPELLYSGERLKHLEEELVRLEKARVQLEKEIQKMWHGGGGERNQSHVEFLTNLSHEMRTPLTSILGHAELMYDARQPVTERLNCIGHIRSQVKTLCGVLDQVFKFSEATDEKTTLDKRPIALISELGLHLSTLRSQALKKRLRFEVLFEGPLPEKIQVNSDHLKQILYNIIGNAIKFTDRGEVRVRVTLRVETDGKPTLVFHVSDTGIGIGADDQKRLFEPFLQVEERLSQKRGGSGLGLVLAQRLARNQGGDIQLVQSAVGWGSTFCITLDPGPLEGVQLLDGISQADLLLRHHVSGDFDRLRLEGMRALVIDDAPDIQKIVQFLLKRLGAEVDLACDGVEGLSRIHHGRYDIVVLDLQMPHMDGFELLSQIRKEGIRTPVVALTAHVMKEFREKCLQVGCEDYLTKPIDTAAFVEVMVRFAPKQKAS